MNKILTQLVNVIDLPIFKGKRTTIFKALILLAFLYQGAASTAVLGQYLPPIGNAEFLIIVGILNERALKFAKDHQVGDST